MSFGTSLNLFLQIKGSQKTMTSISKTEKKIIMDEQKLADFFNSDHTNFVEISGSIKPETIFFTCSINGLDEIQLFLNL